MSRFAVSSAWAGAFVTAAIGVGVLITTTYRAETCWRGPSGSGCRTSSESFASMLLAFPEQVVGPILYVAVLTALAAIVAIDAHRLARAAVRRLAEAGYVALVLYGLIALASTAFLSGCRTPSSASSRDASASPCRGRTPSPGRPPPG